MNKAHAILATIALSSVSMQSQAASLLPTGAFTNLATDASDTATAVAAAVIPVTIAVTLIWGAVSMAKKGTKKAVS